MLMLTALLTLARALSPPLLDTLAAEWQPYKRGLGHPTDPPEWGKPPKHGIALPTANSEVGSVIADENVLAVRDLTAPPFTQGPWSSVARDTSRLGKLFINGHPVYTTASRWTPVGFSRKAEVHPGAVTVQSHTMLPLSENGVLMNVTLIGTRGSPGSSTADSSSSSSSSMQVELELVSEIRSYPASQLNCSEHQWRYPSDMQRNCWNWYAPRAFANESAEFVSDHTGYYKHQHSSSGGVGGSLLWVSRDRVSGAVTAMALASGSRGHYNTPAPTSSNQTAASWIFDSRQLQQPGGVAIGVAVAFGERAEEAAVIARALKWAADLPAAMATAAADRQARFNAVFDPEGARYSGSLPLLSVGRAADNAAARVYYAGIVSLLELERNTSRLPFAPQNTSRAFITGGGSNASTNIFFWDMAYSATALILLEPEMIRNSLLHWMTPALASETLGGWGVDLYSGKAVGNHYAADDFTLFKLARYYVALTGDFDFLSQALVTAGAGAGAGTGTDKGLGTGGSMGGGGMTVLDAMVSFATAYKNLTTNDGSGLADYGLAANLLECVPTYQHKVASFNAGSVWMLEQLAALLKARGRPGDSKAAAEYKATATQMASSVLELYNDGQGFFSALYPCTSANS